MLKKISPLISPELLKVLAEMGHGDEILLADANFPAHSCKAKIAVRADGINIPALLDAVLELFPLDTFVEQPVVMMNVVKGDNYTPEVWPEYYRILAKYGAGEDKIQRLDRFPYYDRAATAYCVVATGETARYGNIILKKGVV